MLRRVAAAEGADTTVRTRIFGEVVGGARIGEEWNRNTVEK